MSRIGKKPISVPAGVTVTCENNHVTVGRNCKAVFPGTGHCS